jgi:carboxyl-terminal processing protease
MKNRIASMNISQTTQRLVITSLLVTLLILVSFLAGYFSREITTSVIFDFPLTREAFSILRDKGLKPLPAQPQLEYGFIRGLLQAYNDPYTTFYEPPLAELQSNQLEGKFGGIGIRLEKSFDGNILLYPLPDSPALKAGLINGDTLIEVENLKITPSTSLDEIQAAIRGPIGKKVKIKALRASQSIEVSVVRAEVLIPSVTYNLAPFDSTTGVIQLNIIASTSSKELIDAIDALQKQGAARFILDLRNNGGGPVDSAADVIRLFVPKGDLLFEQFRSEEARTFKADKPGTFSTLPVVVVVNQNTASAAEIIAGALQRTGRIKIIGNKTFGKDSVQLVYSLKDGSSLHVTAGRWWFPGMEQGIGKSGLTMDVALSDDVVNSTTALEEAVKLLANP